MLWLTPCLISSTVVKGWDYFCVKTKPRVLIDVICIHSIYQTPWLCSQTQLTVLKPAMSGQITLTQQTPITNRQLGVKQIKQNQDFFLIILSTPIISQPRRSTVIAQGWGRNGNLMKLWLSCLPKGFHIVARGYDREKHMGHGGGDVLSMCLHFNVPNNLIF